MHRRWGRGLAPIDREFDPARPKRPSTGRKGSGLGLSFVQEVMTLHGGRVVVESPMSPGGGTRVTLGFPRRGR